VTLSRIIYMAVPDLHQVEMLCPPDQLGSRKSRPTRAAELVQGLVEHEKIQEAAQCFTRNSKLKKCGRNPQIA